MRRTDVVFVILAGGRGERLWPMVRAEVPKACVSMDGKRTLLEATLARLQPLACPESVLIVTSGAQGAPIRNVLSPAFRRTLLVEPQPKNTAACIALAATVLAQRDPTLVMAVVPSDHWITPATAFRQSLRAAIDVARRDERLVTIGLTPTRVHPGLGHLCPGPLRGTREGCRVFRLRRLIEKPPRRLAQRLIGQRGAYWNAGIFIGQVTTFLELIHRWLPHHARRIFPLGAQAGRATFEQRARSAYRELRPVSFDDGVMAHVRDGAIIEGRFDWEDLGSWESWGRVRASRPHQSTLIVLGRNVQVVNADGPVYRAMRGAGRHLVATVGLDDVTIVHTTDATLVCRTQDAQAVRDVVARLSRDRRLARYA